MCLKTQCTLRVAWNFIIHFFRDVFILSGRLILMKCWSMNLKFQEHGLCKEISTWFIFCIWFGEVDFQMFLIKGFSIFPILCLQCSEKHLQVITRRKWQWNMISEIIEYVNHVEVSMTHTETRTTWFLLLNIYLKDIKLYVYVG